LRLVADEILLKLDLVVGFDVHEGERVVAREQEREILFVEIDFLDRLAGANVR
jgi:hypothetical protein